MKQTWSPNKSKRQKRHGFLKRMSTASGQAVLKARRAKKRARLSV